MVNVNRSLKKPATKRPYTAERKARLAIAVAVLGIGLFLISTPAWLLKSPSHEIAKNAVVGLAGALIGYAVTSLVSETFNPTFDAVIEAFDLHSDTEYEGSFRNLVHKEVTAAVAEVTSSSVDFGPRAKLFAKLLLNQAEDAVKIQSISLSQKWQTTQILEELFKRRSKLHVKILLIHPYSPHVEHREQDIGFRAGTIRQLVEESILPLASLRSRDQIRDRLEVRGYFATPYYGLILCDNSRCLVTLSREGRGGDQNYGMLIEGSTQASSSMIADLSQGFDDRWAGSFDLLSPLELSLEIKDKSESNTETVIHLKSDTEIDADSIDCLVENARLVGRKAISTSEVAYILDTRENIGHPVRISVRKALSKDCNKWLQRPVEISIQG